MILVTGGNGFIGRALVERLLADGLKVRASVRQPDADLPQGTERIVVGDIDGDTSWTEALRGVSEVVHTAARVHVMKDRNALAGLYKRVNTDAALNLAKQAAAADVKRFVFLSSIKVNGEYTQPDARFSPISTPAPVDPYGVSKLEAERGLFAIAHSTGMEVVVVRPVLVYGPNVKGNFQRMANWVEKGIPLPLGSIRNRRSMIGIDNLVDLLALAIRHPAARNQVFLVSDGEDLSTSDLLRRTARAFGKSARVFPLPQGVITALAKMLGRGDMALRLCGSLQVDIAKARDVLGWKPQVTVDEGLARYARWKKKRS